MVDKKHYRQCLCRECVPLRQTYEDNMYKGKPPAVRAAEVGKSLRQIYQMRNCDNCVKEEQACLTSYIEPHKTKSEDCVEDNLKHWEWDKIIHFPT